MAAILPTVPVEMPDLAGQAFKLQEYRTAQKKEAADQAQKERSARASQVGVNKLYEQAGEVGQLLNRFKPEVQKAFDTAVKLGEQYTYSGLEEDKRAYLESLGGFNGLLGGAKFHTNNYLEQVNEYRKNQSGFSVTGQEFIDLTTGYSNTPAPVEEIMDINSVFTLPRAEEFKYLAPDAMANAGMQLMSNMADTFSPDGVSFNKEGFLKYAREQWLPTMFPVNSPAELQAVLYGAQALGDGGLGLLRKPSQQDIQRYAALPQEQKEKFKQKYYEDAMKQLTSQVPTQIGQPKEKNPNEGIAKQSIPYMDLVPRTVGVADAKFTKEVEVDGEVVTPSSMKVGAKRNVDMYELPKNLFIETGTFDITGFGVGDDGTQYVRKRRKAKDGTTLEIVTDRADSRDLQIIRNKIGADAYSKYFYY